MPENHERLTMPVFCAAALKKRIFYDCCLRRIRLNVGMSNQHYNTFFAAAVLTFSRAIGMASWCNAVVAR
jgi:hypothetical protein